MAHAKNDSLTSCARKRRSDRNVCSGCVRLRAPQDGVMLDERVPGYVRGFGAGPANEPAPRADADEDDGLFVARSRVIQYEARKCLSLFRMCMYVDSLRSVLLRVPGAAPRADRGGGRTVARRPGRPTARVLRQHPARLAERARRTGPAAGAHAPARVRLQRSDGGRKDEAPRYRAPQPLLAVVRKRLPAALRAEVAEARRRRVGAGASAQKRCPLATCAGFARAPRARARAFARHACSRAPAALSRWRRRRAARRARRQPRRQS